ncbi:unnamed protein product [Spirodela intermedia]|uniref:Adenylate isopentenyltransferase n=1 Tax=Spirodela intermedia TaxID=51605 RepID=A0ABN7EBV5_SPIIN|nr:unnamed protein product [Spirodela intermedia]
MITSLPSSAGGGLGHSMDSFSFRAGTQKDNKVVIVIGATGTGKSRLSLDLAANFPAEIINSDKMQVYKGLDVGRNSHHLLGVVDPDEDFTAADFRRRTASIVESILGRRRLPIIAGGSNSYIEALVNGCNYECCFLWVDVALPKMVAVGLVEEVRGMFRQDGDYSHGIRRAIGVPEMDRYFRDEMSADGAARERLLKEAIEEIKENTRKLASRSGWEVHRLDATEVFRRRGAAADDAWDRLVAAPGVEIVRRFLCESEEAVLRGQSTAVGNCSVKATMGAAMAAAVAVAGSSR